MTDLFIFSISIFKMSFYILREIWSYFRELIYLGTALGGVYIAYEGLNTWKKQIKGKREYDTARKLYNAILKLRDAISYVRNPSIYPSEFKSAELDFRKENPDMKLDQDIDKNVIVYQVRWNRIKDALSVLQLESLEAEVFWGDEVKKIQEPIKQCVIKLKLALMKFANPMLRSGKGNEEKIKEIENIKEIIYEINIDTRENEFTKEIEQAIQKISDFLKPKLSINI